MWRDTTPTASLSTLGMQAPSPSWQHRAHRALTYSLALLMPGPVLSPGRRLGSDRVEGHSADPEAGETDRCREAGSPELEVQQPNLLEASGRVRRGSQVSQHFPWCGLEASQGGPNEK